MPGRQRARAVQAPPVPELVERVRETVAGLTLRPEDVALSTLAVRYAETIERAAELAEEAAQLPYDPELAAQVARLKARVDAHVVMSELGPKLLAALDALGATPKARAAAGKPAPSSAVSKLHALREGA